MSVLSTFFAFFALISAQNKPIPQNIILLYSPQEKVPLRETIEFGFQNNFTERIFGVQRTVLATLTDPLGNVVVSHLNQSDTCAAGGLGGALNGSESKIGLDLHTTGKWVLKVHFGTQILRIDVLSRWLRWSINREITYNVTADPSKANSTYCGPGPYSIESWNLTHTFEVIQVGTSSVVVGTATAATFTSELPSEPTGKGRDDTNTTASTATGVGPKPSDSNSLNGKSGDNNAARAGGVYASATVLASALSVAIGMMSILAYVA
jgi:hypothetical protein